MDLQIVIGNHSKVFREMPKGLPPTPNHDSAIHLQLGSVPPNIRPYRYSYAQRSTIEHMVQEMLEASIIQTNQSDLSSPVVMVYKNEGSWHMCPYCREIKQMAFKDKFHIPVIDELLNELQGAIFFTELDIHFGYHQIIMRQEDIPKTTFETPEGHYEFMALLFGLINAPSTFQSLMNSIFKPFLTKTLLIFLWYTILQQILGRACTTC
jgi:hypothetical protein